MIQDPSDQPAKGPDAPAHAGAPPTLLEKLGPASILAIVSLVLPPLGGFLILGFMDTIATWLTSHGVSGIILYAVTFALAAGLAFLPTYSQSILGGWAFGISTGFSAALGGFVGGAAIGYAIARPVASSRVNAIINEHPRWAIVRDEILSAGFWRTLVLVTLIRLPPNSPFAITNLVLASVRMPWLTFMLGTALGMSPRTFAAVWLGHHLKAQFASLREALSADKPVWLIICGIALSILVVMIILGIVGMVAKRSLDKMTARAADPGPRPL